MTVGLLRGTSRSDTKGTPGVEAIPERKTFGGLSVTLNGSMCRGIANSDLVVRSLRSRNAQLVGGSATFQIGLWPRVEWGRGAARVGLD